MNTGAGSGKPNKGKPSATPQGFGGGAGMVKGGVNLDHKLANLGSNILFTR